MIEYGVDMAFVAHDHQYMRFKPFQAFNLAKDKFVEVIVGTGGTTHHFEKQTLPQFELMEREFSKVKGGLIGHFTEGEYYFEFKSIHDQVFDAFHYPSKAGEKEEESAKLRMALYLVGALSFAALLIAFCFIH